MGSACLTSKWKIYTFFPRTTCIEQVLPKHGVITVWAFSVKRVATGTPHQQVHHSAVVCCGATRTERTTTTPHGEPSLTYNGTCLAATGLRGRSRRTERHQNAQTVGVLVMPE
jgi:hypothetical protein